MNKFLRKIEINSVYAKIHCGKLEKFNIDKGKKRVFRVKEDNIYINNAQLYCIRTIVCWVHFLNDTSAMIVIVFNSYTCTSTSEPVNNQASNRVCMCVCASFAYVVGLPCVFMYVGIMDECGEYERHIHWHDISVFWTNTIVLTSIHNERTPFQTYMHPSK